MMVPISASVIMVAGEMMVRMRRMMMVAFCFQLHPPIRYAPELLLH